jgi:biopolymer transport protein ExbD
MITRPLDLASRLRPPPRSFDWLFFVNAGLLGLFFALFGSHFVLAPGLGVDFRLPVVAGANAAARPPSHSITVTSPGQIFTSDGLCKLADLPLWLKKEAANRKDLVLLVRASGVSMDLIVEITNHAQAAGFAVIMAGSDPATSGEGAR